MGDISNAESKERRTRREEEALRGDADSDRLGGIESKGYKGWTIPVGAGGTSGKGDNVLGHEDPTPGGIASRLIEKLLEQRAEVQGRYEIVLKRKSEYEEKLTQIDREIEEARAIAQEILQIDKGDDDEPD